MTRTDVVASSRPQAAGVALMRGGSLRALRRLLVLPIVLLLAVALLAPTTAIAAEKEGLSGYNQKPGTGTSPSKEKSTPSTTPTKTTAPATTSSAPSTETTTKASTLPFTGFDLRWTVGVGLLLMGAGFSIVTVQRRQRRDPGR